MQIISKSAMRNHEKIEANNCPIESTCGYLHTGKPQEKCQFCGYFGGTIDVDKDLLVVACRYPC